MFVLTAALASNAPTFEDHLASERNTRSHVLPADGPTLAMQRERTRRALQPVMELGFVSSGLGLLATGIGYGMVRSSSFWSSDGGVFFGGLMLAGAGIGLAVSGAVVGSIATVRYGVAMRRHDREVEAWNGAPRVSLRVSPTGVSGRF